MKKSKDGICHIKLTRRDVCAMCQTSAERLKKLEAIAEAALALRDHWNDEHAHFACGGEAILLESLAALEDK